MTCDPHASLHLGLSAEAMMLIDPQLGDPWAPDGVRPSLLLPVILSIVLLMLIPGAPFAEQGGLRQLARAMECSSRCHEPPVIAAPKSILSH